MPEKIIDVAVGVLLRPDGTVLLGNRPADKPWPGWWELPGGKLEPGESVMQALARELLEELGIQIHTATPWVTYVHAYPTTTVRLAFCRVTGWDGEPQGLEGQLLRWVPLTQALDVPKLLPATYPPLRWMNLPEVYAISSAGSPQGLAAFQQRLAQGLKEGVKLLQWREPGWPDGPASTSLKTAFDAVLAQCHAAGARVVVNSVHPSAWCAQGDGMHLRAADAKGFSVRPELPAGHLVGVSTHDLSELQHARKLEADFAVLGPVLPTASHPDHPGIGWEEFARLNQQAGLPVYALGGQSAETLAQAKSVGGHGFAGLRRWIT
ncbi:Nudix family hydrolase [Alcaligenaceae bacterium LF4-65]|jgi:8-oxo-dGTP diphosphatase|uniref:8-oxo-dGTP diphosphatase n=1 Tax=Zwartia hollandica TaxID=324606 RepID=A0A953T1K2_9BURK|nr:Nudix family hydrolase [Zwartia hollandica]MBZ1350388.1 Nudix family hydrolase [Zwartia hollandica]